MSALATRCPDSINCQSKLLVDTMQHPVIEKSTLCFVSAPCTQRLAKLLNARHGPNGSIAVSLAKLTNLNRSLVNSREDRVGQHRLFRLVRLFRLIVAAAAMMALLSLSCPRLVYATWCAHSSIANLYKVLTFVQETNCTVSALSHSRNLETPTVKGRLMPGVPPCRWSGQYEPLQILAEPEHQLASH